MTTNQVEIVHRAINYIYRVVTTQQRILSFEDMADGYFATIGHNQLTRDGLRVVYEETINTISEIRTGGQS